MSLNCMCICQVESWKIRQKYVTEICLNFQRQERLGWMPNFETGDQKLAKHFYSLFEKIFFKKL